MWETMIFVVENSNKFQKIKFLEGKIITTKYECNSLIPVH
jgi:hypothetical protein